MSEKVESGLEVEIDEAEPAPAQDERQPTAVPEGWLIELGFDVLDRPFRFVDSQSHSPTIKVILPACEPDDSSSWDLRDEIARRIGSVLAAPIAQTAPQPEQGGLVEAAKAFADAARNNIYPCPDKPNSLSGKLQALDDAIATALSAQGGEQ